MERGRGKEREKERGTWGEGEGKERIMEMGRGKTQTGRQTDRETDRQRQKQRHRDRDNLADITAKLNLYSMSFVKKQNKKNKKNCEQFCSIGEHWTVCLSIYIRIVFTICHCKGQCFTHDTSLTFRQRSQIFVDFTIAVVI